MERRIDSGPMSDLPAPEGTLTRNANLADYTWLKVGGPADWLFKPASVEDLAKFMRNLPGSMNAYPLGAGSNLIVRDGGLRAVVVRLGHKFANIAFSGDTVSAGAATRVARLASESAGRGIDLTFLRTIPGTVGGAVRMNAGCYGSYVEDNFQEARIVTRDGRIETLTKREIGFAYRSSQLPGGAIIVEAKFKGSRADPGRLHELMARQIERRNSTQPSGEMTAGSIFRNPAGHSSSGAEGECHEGKAWKLIDQVGMRGAVRGGARISELHSNFLINDGSASAFDLECLAEEARKKVLLKTGIALSYEVVRVGEHGPGKKKPCV
ncbi:MAG: UDP-N-acetylmuramate dehydrogenase [Albidovulum sp.]|nr:UDP-N-acetylmuramate dehydrogenase [Albidovulum sp.]